MLDAVYNLPFAVISEPLNTTPTHPLLINVEVNSVFNKLLNDGAWYWNRVNFLICCNWNLALQYLESGKYS